MRTLIIFFFTIPIFCRVYGQKVAEFRFEDETGSLTTTESVTNTPFMIANKYNRAERIEGVAGKALRLDATSTWGYNNSYVLGEISNKLTIETWYATEAFAPDVAALVSQETASGGFSLEVGPFGNVSMALFYSGTRMTLKSTKVLEHYKWYHVAATVDVSAGVARIFVNGEQWAQNVFTPSAATISLSNSPFYVGRQSTLKTEQGFPVNAANGVIDELVIYNEILTTETIADHYNIYASLIPDLHIDSQVRHADDRLRPQYHPMPTTSWTNEPYGLIFYQGKYHLFFQKNPNGPFLYFMHWGHLTSTDLVNWKEEKIPIGPAPSFDSFGNWSGTTIAGPDGKPVIIYTGVDGVKAGIGVAFPNNDDLIEWTKYSGNPVIQSPPPGYAHMDFRDPYVWKVGGTYYMIVGSGLQNNGGGILFTYKSTDLKNWTSVTPLFRRTDVAVTGNFWEMPFFIPIGDNKWVLQVLPTPQPGKRARSIYWIGKFENEKFIPDFEAPKDLEIINENLLAPAVGWDEENRLSYIGILPEDRDVNAQVAAGWRHTFSIPRIVRLLKDSTLGYYPHPNLCRLRTNPLQIENRVINRNTSFNLPEFSGDQMELRFTVKADSASRFLIQVFKHQDATEFVSLVFDLKKNIVGLDRRFSTLSSALKDNREATYIFNHKDTIDVQIYLDHSTIEVFVDNLVTFSCRAYPSRAESNKIDFVVSDGAAKIIALKSWQMQPMNVSASIDVCEPSQEELPDALRKPPVISGPVTDIEIIEIREKAFMLYPNPAGESFIIDYRGARMPTAATLEIFDSTGALMRTVVLKTQDQKIDVSEMNAGIYFTRIRYGKNSQMFKVIIIR